MLVSYSLLMFFPGGGPAISTPVSVALHGSNVQPILFTDAAGTIPASNPVMTDGTGVLSFYAAPGCYRAELAGDTFDVPIDPAHTDPVWPGLWVHTQAVASTVWTVEHHFGVRPAVELIIGGADFEAEVTHPDDETTVITFGSPLAGTAMLRR